MIKPYSSFAKFIYMHWYGRYKMTHDPFYRMNWNAPYSKESKYMIYPECIEVITHLLKSPAPPFKMIFLHFFPVVSWKSPVLPFYCKIIRRRPGLEIQVV